MTEYPQHRCETCLNSEREKERIERQKKENIARMADARAHWALVANVPARFLDVSFDNFQKELAPKAFDFMRSYSLHGEEGKNSVVLYSPGIYGVGKTHLVAAAVNNIIATGKVGHVSQYGAFSEHTPAIRFFREIEIMQEIRSTYQPGSQWTEADVYEKTLSSHLIVIDDVGKIKPRDMSFTQTVYFNIVDSAYNNFRDIIITTNLSLSELEAHIGGAAADRLKEMAKFIEIKGKSYRKIQG